MFCMTFCRRCGAQLASHRNIMQLLTVKAQSTVCYSSASHQHLGQFLQDLVIRVSWRLCVTHEVHEACKIQHRGKERKGGDDGLHAWAAMLLSKTQGGLITVRKPGLL